MTLSKKYKQNYICHRPWTSLDVDPMGEYRPCCIYNETIIGANGKPLTVYDTSIREAIESPYMENLRKEFLNGGQPSQCGACWKEEAAGKKSQRIHMWEKNPFSILGQYNIEKNTVTPYELTIRLGNICNLKCRICSEYFSSQWTNEKIKQNKNDKELTKQLKLTNKRGQWPRDDMRYFDNIDDILKNVRYFEFAGGEPLLINEHYEILKKCITLGVAKKIEIHYNSNGTIYPGSAIEELWPHFRRVELALSIDDTGDRFEYQRHPAKWPTVKDNIIRIKNSGLNNLSLQICTTINVMNILYLAELSRAVDEFDPEFWHINILHEPVEFDVQRIPTKIKKMITNRLKTQNSRKEIQTAVDYMNNCTYDTANWQQLLYKKLQQTDKIRKEKFQNTFAELHALIQ
jgi:hypothetical protein